MAAACKVCVAKNQTIAAQKVAIDTLVEMVNLQRAIPAASPPPPPIGATPSTGLSLVQDGSPDIEDVMAQLNQGDVDEKQAEQLMAAVQAFNTSVERAD